MSHDQTTETEVKSVKKPVNLDDARAAIFATRAPRTVIIEFFGVEVEIRQPRMGDVIDRAADEETKKNGLVTQLIAYGYLPGTDQKIFTPEDIDSLKALPFGKDYSALADALVQLMDVDVGKPKST